jgi:hypothetical protein
MKQTALALALFFFLCLVSELQKMSSSKLNSAIFVGCGLYSCHILAGRKNFDLGAISLFCLVSNIQKLSSP